MKWGGFRAVGKLRHYIYLVYTWIFQLCLWAHFTDEQAEICRSWKIQVYISYSYTT